MTPFSMADALSNGILVLIGQRTPSRHDGRLLAKEPRRQLSNQSLQSTPLTLRR